MTTLLLSKLNECCTSFVRHLHFIVAALSLLLTGVAYPGQLPLENAALALMIWGCISGILIVYRYNDYAYRSESPWRNTGYFFRNWYNSLIVFQFFVVGIPLCAMYLTNFQFLTFALAGITGVFYAVNFRLGSFSWMVKFVPVVKNLLIGFAWALLFAAGHGHLSTMESLSFFLFIALQVFIGSSIRDITDISLDLKKGLSTIPTVIGEKNTILLLQVLNLSGCALLLLANEMILATTVIFIILYRSCNLWMIHKKGGRSNWTQTYNLATCFLIFCATLILRYATD